MAAEIGQAERPGIEDEQPENAMALGQVSDGLGHLGRDAHADKLRQPIAALRHNAESSVAGTDDLDGGGDDIAQDVGE